jgi:hypothetical protein
MKRAAVSSLILNSRSIHGRKLPCPTRSLTAINSRPISTMSCAVRVIRWRMRSAVSQRNSFVGFDDCCGGDVRNAIDCSSHEQLATNYFAMFASCAASFDLSRSRGRWISNTFRNLNST